MGKLDTAFEVYVAIGVRWKTDVGLPSMNLVSGFRRSYAALLRLLSWVDRSSGGDGTKHYWFVIDVDASRNTYLNQIADPRKLVEKVIGNDQTVQSVFRVENAVDEVEVLAARFLTYRRSTIDSRLSFRILPDDLA